MATNHKYSPEEFEKKNWDWYNLMTQSKHEFPSLPGFLTYAGIYRKDYDAMCKDEAYEDIIEKFVNLRSDYLMRGQNDAKKANGYARLLTYPENGGYSDKNVEPEKKLIIEIREFKDGD